MKKHKIIIASIILFLLGCFGFYLKSFSGVLNLIYIIGFYTIILYLINIIWRKIRKKEIISSGIFIQNFLYYISLFILIVFLIIFGLVYYFNEINPAKMPEYTISNGTKIVKFQTMIHIAKPSFYEKVKENLTNFKKKGAIYFYEGVKSGTKENHDSFNKAIGFKFDKDLYSNFSKLYGVTSQDSSMFLNLINDKDINVDIGIDKIMEMYNKIPKEFGKESSNEPININKEILETLYGLNEKEIKILISINQAVLNFLIGSEKIKKELEELNNKNLFSIILGERNKVLATEIIKSPYNKIFITYGELHFKGVFEILKKNDPNWKIIETKYLYPIK